MKKLILLSYTSLLLVFLLNSCAIDKRLYRDGYHIEWSQKKSEINKKYSTAEASDQLGNETEEKVKQEEWLTFQTETFVVDSEQKVPVSAEGKEIIKSGKKKNCLFKTKKDKFQEEAQLNNTGKASTFSEGFKKGFTALMPVQDGRIHPLAIASFVVGIISLFSYYGAFVLGILAIIFGAIALKKIRNEGYRGSTLAWIGLICGIVSIALILTYISVY